MNHDIRAFCMQTAHDRGADAPRGACDERDASCEVDGRIHDVTMFAELTSLAYRALRDGRAGGGRP